MTGYLRPSSLAEALAARRDHPDWVILCGGTDLLVSAPARPEPAGLIDLFGMAPLVGVEPGEDGGVVIRAATTYWDLIASPLAQRDLPALVAAAREVGALQIQARGTIGGNIGTSSPVGDTLPVLLALDAELALASTRGVRTVPYARFCTGYRQTALAADELIVAVSVPAQPPGTRQLWRKVGTRRAQSISKVMVAAALRVEGGVIASARIGLGAVADRPIRAHATEAAIVGQPATEATADRARAALAGELHPIDDVRSTADYRLGVAQNVVARFIVSLGEEALPT